MNKNRNMGIVQQENHSSHGRSGSICRRILCKTFMLMLIAVVVCLVSAGVGAGAVEQWNKTFGGTNYDYAHSVQQTSDGGYIIAGRTRSYGAGFSDAWLIKTDTDGNLQWNKTFGGTNDDLVYSVQQTSDGSYVLAGGTRSYGVGNGDAWLIKVSGEANNTGTVHNINKSTNYTTIQAAIDDASPGDAIHVESGTYYENVNVNKQLTLRAIDTGTGIPVVDAMGSGSAITLAADGITLEGFTATGAGDYPDACIRLTSSSNTLSGNNVSNNYAGNVYGIFLSYSNNNKILGNNASNNFNGIRVISSSNNTLSGNNAKNNNYGIFLYQSSNNTLNNNTANSNDVHGIWLFSSSDNTLSNNTASNNNYGIFLVESSDNNTLSNNNVNSNSNYGIRVISSSNNNTLSNNTASNSYYGISLSYSSDNELNNNIASNNDVGISLSSSSNNNELSNNTANSNNDYGISLSFSSNNNTLINNTANSNDNYGIYLSSSSNNILYHNNLDNTNNVKDDSNNQWDSDAEGNYYSDYPGTDSNGDGIGDTPYPIPGGSSVDNYPLMAPWSENNGDSTPPIINITSPTNGSTVTSSTITISGTASDDVAVANVTVNDIPATGTTSWSVDVTLAEGANTITVVATDSAGNTATKTITITYTPDDARGDFNGNGRVDIGDVAKVAFMVAGKVPVDMNADFNNNGRVDIGDAAKIAFYLAGKVNEL